MRAGDPLTLFDVSGGRKYLCASEVPRFLDAARRADLATGAFCCLLAFTGCRLSEALAVTPAQLDPETGRVIFRTLKRRKRAFRAVPVPPDLMGALRRIAKDRPRDASLWGWCRQTAWRHVKRVMDAAGIAGAHATPKGLRHGFGVANAEENVPMATTQKWLGHAKLETTAIYQQAVGREEHAFARRLWRNWRER
jgi:integrase/recombinase XerD